MSSFLKRRWWVLLILAVVLGLWRLRFDVDVLDLLPSDEPTVQGLKLYERHFTNARELVLSLRAPDPAQAEKLAETLADRLRQQTNLVDDVLWQAPWMEHPEQLGELLACIWLNQPPGDFAALTNRFTPDLLKAQLDRTKEELTTSIKPMDVARHEFDPFDLLNMPTLTNLSGLSMDQSPQMFASSNGTFRLLYVQAAVDLSGYRECESWLKSIHGVVDGLRAEGPKDDWDGVVIRFTGRPVFVEEIATSMQRDMSHSVGITATIIALLFWLTHRRWLPMLWLLALLGVILFATLALGGLVLGTINVISLGFAAVLLGLAVDYAVVHYQEALAHPDLSVPEIRRAIAPSIIWAAITTMSAFLVLNWGGLPGLGQLGSLVAIGVATSALVMVMIYLPPLFPDRRKPPANQPPARWWNYFVAPLESSVAHAPQTKYAHGNALRLTGLILAVVCAVLCFRRPGLDRTGDALRPLNGEAQNALDELTREMNLPPDPVWVIVSGRDEPETYQHLITAGEVLDGAVSNKLIGRYVLPTPLWPRAEFQNANRVTAAFLGKQGPLLENAALADGFNSNALVLTGELLHTWAGAGSSTGVVWPTNHLSRWLLKRFVAQAPNQWLVMGLVYPATNHIDSSALAGLSSRLAEKGALLSSWQLLGAATLRRVQSRMWQVVTPMLVLVLASLWFAFRRWTEILLGVAVLCMSGLCLLAVMSLANWSWNLMNLMAVPLILGTGVDYCIFMQLALRRHGGDLVIARRSVGRALMLCGGTAMAGFGSLALSSNAGMAGLGRVCAVGIGANMLISVFLLPSWWTRLRPNAPDSGNAPETPPAPPVAQPAFYRAGLWRTGLAVVRILPASLVKAFCVLVAEVHYLLQPQRRDMVTQNLLPVVGGNRTAAKKAVHRLHRKFAAKLVDLWRVENGVPVTNWITNQGELEIIRTARARGHGTLFITLHLGNWEHGGLLLNQLGIRLTILTLAEPDDGLTGLRKASRARFGVDTLIIGRDSFAFVEVIKQLQAGADLAISLDRPPERGSVPIQFFGHPFEASPAAAELARASGCALIGVTIVRRPNGYAVKVLPEFTYDRKALGNRDARRDLTQQILRAFEPEICKDVDQWYQFVPIWPAAG